MFSYFYLSFIQWPAWKTKWNGSVHLKKNLLVIKKSLHSILHLKICQWYICLSFINWKSFRFVLEHITDLRNKLENKEVESRRKDRLISELEAKLDASKISNNNQAQIEDISIPARNSYLYQIAKQLHFLKFLFKWFLN